MKKCTLLYGGGVLGQGSLEYLWVYVVVFIIAVIIAYYIFISYSSINNIVPAKCVFDYGIGCIGLIEASNNSNTMIALLGTNTQPYPIYNPKLFISQDGFNMSTNCTPSYVKPGQVLLCIGKINEFKPVLSYTSGTAIVNAKYCGFSFGNCSDGVEENFIGNYSSNVKRLIMPKVSLVIAPVNNYAKSNQNITLNVGLDIFGYILPVANPELISNNPSIRILYNAQDLSNGFITVSSNGTASTATITISYAGLSANTSVVFIPAYPKIIVTNLLSDNITIINASNGAESTLSNFTLPESVAVSSNGTLAYITTPSRVKILSLSNNNIIGSIQTGSYPSAIVDANGYLYIANAGSNNVTIANENGAIIKSFHTGIFPNYIAKSGNNNYIFVLNQLSENITEISSLSIAHVIRLWAMPYAIASNYNGSIVYVTLPSLNRVAAIYTNNNTIAWQSYAGFIPFGIAYNSKYNRLYITDVGTSSVSILNATTGSMLGSIGGGLPTFASASLNATTASTLGIGVGFLPTFAATSSDLGYEYILSSGSNMLSIVNASTNKVIATYRTGIFPTSVAET